MAPAGGIRATPGTCSSYILPVSVSFIIIRQSKVSNGTWAKFAHAGKKNDTYLNWLFQTKIQQNSHKKLWSKGNICYMIILND